MYKQYFPYSMPDTTVYRRETLWKVYNLSNIFPFASELPVTAHTEQQSLYAIWRYQLSQSRTTLLPNLFRGWDLSNHIKISKGQGKRQNHVKLARKFLWKCCSPTSLHFLPSHLAFLKGFPKSILTKMKTTRQRQTNKREKITGGDYWKERGRRKVKGKTRDLNF